MLIHVASVSTDAVTPSVVFVLLCRVRGFAGSEFKLAKALLNVT
jgi:hypothetical protein